MSAQNVMVAEKKPASTVVPPRSLGLQHHPSLLPGHVEETPAPGGRSLDSTLAQPGLGHDFGRIRVHPEAETTQSAHKEACPLGLSSPTFCPFGGACHTCPVQAKLVVNEPGDKYEQEADRVAERVMRMPEPHLQRQAEPEEEEEEPVQAKQSGGQTPQADPGLEARIHSLRSDGQPLPRSVRSFFEPRFGHDFGRVRVHTDIGAADSARAASARAYTVGHNVVFGMGCYAPYAEDGRRLLAHELTHVIQQGHASRSSPSALATPVNISPKLRAPIGLVQRHPATSLSNLNKCGDIDRATLSWIYPKAEPLIFSHYTTGKVFAAITGRKDWKKPSKWAELDTDIFFSLVPQGIDPTQVFAAAEQAKKRHIKLTVEFSWSPSHRLFLATGKFIDWLDGHPIILRSWEGYIVFSPPCKTVIVDLPRPGPRPEPHPKPPGPYQERRRRRSRSRRAQA